MEELERMCTRCQEFKPLEEFHRRRNDSLAKWCKDCRRASGRLEGRGYQSEEAEPTGPVELLTKWRDYRDKLIKARERLGMQFSVPARVQLGLAEEFVQDLELALTWSESQAC
jgi:hypothetical protein